MRVRLRYALPTLLALSMVGCGGSNSSPVAAVVAPTAVASGTNTESVAIEPSAQVVQLPAFQSVTGTLSLSPSNAALGTMLQITARPGQQSDVLDRVRSKGSRADAGVVDVYNAYDISYSKAVTYTTTPSLTFTLPSSIATAGKTFYAGVTQPSSNSAVEAQLVTVGPALISGQTLTFDATQTPISFAANRSYDLVLYSVSDATTSAYVADNGTAVKIFPTGANGNVAPSRVITGSATGLQHITALALDAQGELFVADSGSGPAGSGSIRIFASGANGNVSPVRVISGAKALTALPSALIVDTDGTLYVGEESEMLPFSSTPATTPTAAIARFAPGVSGNVAPKASLATIELVQALILDATDTNIIYAGLTATCCSSDLETIPKTLTSSTTLYDLAKDGFVTQLAADPANASYFTGGGLDLADTTSGLDIPPEYGHDYFDPQPLGSLNFVCGSNGIALDPAGEVLVASAAGSAPCTSPEISVYVPGTSSPVRTISGSATTLVSPSAIAVGP